MRPISCHNAVRAALLVGCAALLPGMARAQNAVRVERFAGGQLVRVALRQVQVRVVLARDQIGATEPLAAMARRTGALAAINGSYFQAYNNGAWKPPVMTQIAGGRLHFRGDIGTLAGFTPDGRVVMARSPEAVAAWQSAHAAPDSPQEGEPDSAWRDVTDALGCGPRLLDRGRIVLDARSEGFNNPKVLCLSTARSALGVTAKGELLLVAASGTMTEMARLMQKLGCTDALNLDGGASSGLWTRARSLRAPGRALSNALVIVPR